MYIVLVIYSFVSMYVIYGIHGLANIFNMFIICCLISRPHMFITQHSNMLTNVLHTSTRIGFFLSTVYWGPRALNCRAHHVTNLRKSTTLFSGQTKSGRIS